MGYLFNVGVISTNPISQRRGGGAFHTHTPGNMADLYILYFGRVEGIHDKQHDMHHTRTPLDVLLDRILTWGSRLAPKKLPILTRIEPTVTHTPRSASFQSGD